MLRRKAGAAQWLLLGSWSGSVFGVGGIGMKSRVHNFIPTSCPQLHITNGSFHSKNKSASNGKDAGAPDVVVRQKIATRSTYSVISELFSGSPPCSCQASRAKSSEKKKCDNLIFMCMTKVEGKYK
ncbi:unnamed protein product [Amoebophrya sp. A120]|nr:unnamed protein product [Amoebophrya sp. A120]|eukprot:GSA120T00023646001.1